MANNVIRNGRLQEPTIVQRTRNDKGKRGIRNLYARISRFRLAFRVCVVCILCTYTRIYVYIMCNRFTAKPEHVDSRMTNESDRLIDRFIIIVLDFASQFFVGDFSLIVYRSQFRI